MEGAQGENLQYWDNLYFLEVGKDVLHGIKV